MPSAGGKLIKLSASYISTAWISPQCLWEMYLRFKKLAVWYNFTLCLLCSSTMSMLALSWVLKWLELNIYSLASLAGIKVLRDTLALSCGMNPAVTFIDLHLSVGVQSALNWIWDMHLNHLPVLNGLPFSAQVDTQKTTVSEQMETKGCYLCACQNIRLFYFCLGQRSEVIADIKGNFNSVFPFRVW